MDWGRDLPGWQMGTGPSPHALSSLSDPGALTDYPFRTGLARFKPTLSLDSSQNPQRNEVASSAEALFNLVNGTEHGG